jgi:hypothetical protein
MREANMRNRKKNDGRRRRLRIFAWTLALALALVGWMWLSRSPWGLLLELTAAVIFAVGATWPRTFEGLYRVVGPAKRPRFDNGP